MPQCGQPSYRQQDQSRKLRRRTCVFGTFGQFVLFGGCMVDGGFDGGVEQFGNQRNEGCGNQQQPDGKIKVEDAGEDNQRQIEPAYLAERALMPVGGLESVFGIAVGIDDAFDAGFAFFLGCVGFVAHGFVFVLGFQTA